MKFTRYHRPAIYAVNVLWFISRRDIFEKKHSKIMTWPMICNLKTCIWQAWSRLQFATSSFDWAYAGKCYGESVSQIKTKNELHTFYQHWVMLLTLCSLEKYPPVLFIVGPGCYHTNLLCLLHQDKLVHGGYQSKLPSVDATQCASDHS